MELLTPSLGMIFWVLVAFLVLAIILKKFAWKPILSALQAREEGITAALATAEKAKEEMSALKSENENLLAKAKEERNLLLKDARDTAQTMLTEAKEKAKREYDKILSDAQIAIRQQTNAELAKAKQEIVSLVISVSKKVLQKELCNQAEQEKYIHELSDNVVLN